MKKNAVERSLFFSVLDGADSYGWLQAGYSLYLIQTNLNELANKACVDVFSPFSVI
jgi:hypothetical protein